MQQLASMPACRAACRRPLRCPPRWAAVRAFPERPLGPLAPKSAAGIRLDGFLRQGKQQMDAVETVLTAHLAIVQASDEAEELISRNGQGGLSDARSQLMKLRREQRDNTICDLLYAHALAQLTLHGLALSLSAETTATTERDAREVDALLRLHSAGEQAAILKHCRTAIDGPNAKLSDATLMEASTHQLAALHKSTMQLGFFLRGASTRLRLESLLTLGGPDSASGDPPMDDVQAFTTYVDGMETTALTDALAQMPAETAHVIKEHIAALFGRRDLASLAAEFEAEVGPGGAADLATRIKSAVQRRRIDRLTVSIGSLRKQLVESATLGALLYEAGAFMALRFPRLLV